jgi:hypothetical protein
VVPHLMRQPDPIGTRRLYQQATGVDRDRAREDVELVADRLAPLCIAAAHVPGGDALVRNAARWLVDWVAAGRARGGPLRDVELRSLAGPMPPSLRRRRPRRSGWRERPMSRRGTGYCSPSGAALNPT